VLKLVGNSLTCTYVAEIILPRAWKASSGLRKKKVLTWKW